MDTQEVESNPELCLGADTHLSQGYPQKSDTNGRACFVLYITFTVFDRSDHKLQHFEGIVEKKT